MGTRPAWIFVMSPPAPLARFERSQRNARRCAGEGIAKCPYKPVQAGHTGRTLRVLRHARPRALRFHGQPRAPRRPAAARRPRYGAGRARRIAPARAVEASGRRGKAGRGVTLWRAPRSGMALHLSVGSPLGGGSAAPANDADAAVVPRRGGRWTVPGRTAGRRGRAPAAFRRWAGRRSARIPPIRRIGRWRNGSSPDVYLRKRKF